MADKCKENDKIEDKGDPNDKLLTKNIDERSKVGTKFSFLQDEELKNVINSVAKEFLEENKKHKEHKEHKKKKKKDKKDKKDKKKIKKTKKEKKYANFVCV